MTAVFNSRNNGHVPFFFNMCHRFRVAPRVSAQRKRADASHLCGRVAMVSVAAAITGCCLRHLSSGSQPLSLPAGAAPQRRPGGGEVLSERIVFLSLVGLVSC